MKSQQYLVENAISLREDNNDNQHKTLKFTSSKYIVSLKSANVHTWILELYESLNPKPYASKKLRLK